MRRPLTLRLATRIFRRDRRGGAATEFAFVMPLLLLFVGGIVELGRFLQVYGAVNRLATRYAGTYADCYDYPSGTCRTELATFAAPATIQNLAPQLTGASVTLRIFQVSMSDATPPAATVTYASPSGATLTTAELAQARTLIGAGQSGVVVNVSYQHSLLFFSQVMASSIGSASKTVSYTIAQRKS